MEQASIGYIIDTVHRTNVLPVISECNTSCIFCSHRQNPENVEVYRLPRLSLSDFKEISCYLSKERKIIIGESATRIIEGEPLLHPDFIGIVEHIRQKFPKTPVQVTTNGILLNGELVKRIAELGNIELNVSINCVNRESRKKLLGRPYGEDIGERLALLKGRLRFSGSIVSVPGVLSWEEVEETIRMAEHCGSDMVRLFVPGTTRFSKSSHSFSEVYPEAAAFTAEMREKTGMPLILEPAVLSDLLPKVEGVIRNTPAFDAGLRYGDIIAKVNGKAAVSRVHAFNLAFSAQNPQLTVRRGCMDIELPLVKPKNSSPGFIVLFDADPDTLPDIEHTALRHGARNVLVVTSRLAVNALGGLLDKANLPFRVRTAAAENSFFGGSICCAGLLTIEDIIGTVKRLCTDGESYDLILLPPLMFDYRGRDLTGRHISEVEKEVGILTEVP